MNEQSNLRGYSLSFRDRGELNQNGRDGIHGREDGNEEGASGSVDDNVGVVLVLLTTAATDGGCGVDEGDGGDVGVVDVTQ